MTFPIYFDVFLNKIESKIQFEAFLIESLKNLPSINPLTPIRFSKNGLSILKLLHLWVQFSRRIVTLESKTIPPIDSKFNVDSENGVIFEIQRAKFWDIKQNVQHGEFGTPEAYGCQRVNQATRTWLFPSILMFFSTKLNQKYNSRLSWSKV